LVEVSVMGCSMLSRKASMVFSSGEWKTGSAGRN
jgi:hypothetical protein